MAAKKPVSPAKRARDRRKYLRAKRTAGTLTAAELPELAKLEEGVGGAPQEGAADPDDATPAEQEAEAQQEVTPDAAAPPPARLETPVAPAAPLPSLPLPPPLARPPRVEAAPLPEENSAKRGGRAAGADWRDEWRAKASGLGREGTVVGIADKILGLYKVLDAQCVAAGAGPLPFDIDLELKPAMVLTIDRVLPDKVKATPEIMVVLGSATIVTRRVIHRKAIGEMELKRLEREKHDQFRKNQHLRSVPLDAAEPAAPPPAMETSRPLVPSADRVPISPAAAEQGDRPSEAAASVPVPIVTAAAPDEEAIF